MLAFSKLSHSDTHGLVSSLVFIMISARSLKLYVLSCQLGVFILPFRWNASTEKFELNPKLVQRSWQSLIWFCQVAAAILGILAYILLVAYLILFDDSLSKAEKALAGYQISLCLIVLPMHGTIYFSAPYVVHHVNSLMQLNKSLRKFSFLKQVSNQLEKM